MKGIFLFLIFHTDIKCRMYNYDSCKEKIKKRLYMNKKEQKLRDVWEKSDKFLKKILYANIVGNYKILSYSRTHQDFIEKFDYMEKLKNLKSLIIRDIDFYKFNSIPENWLPLLEQIEELYIESHSFKLFPFERLKNIKKLTLGYCKISNIREIESLTRLEELNAYEINFKIDKLINLKKIKIEIPKISDLENLKYITNLKSLSISGSRVDRSFNKVISNLNQINELDVSFCYNFDFNCLYKLKNLKHLNIGHIWEPSIKSIIPIASNLESLNLEGNIFKDLHLLKKFNNLKSLDVSQCNVDGYLDFDFLKSLTKLEFFRFDDNTNKIKNFYSVRFCKNLKKISFEYSNLDSIKGLEYCKHLEWINATCCNIKSLSSLRKLNGLKYVYLQNCGITNIEPLRNQVNLIELDLYDNPIDDISPLINVLRIEYLSLGGYRNSKTIKDLSILKDKVYLKDLDLVNQNIQDISLLENMKELQTLNLSGNELDEVKIKKLKKLKKLKDLNLADCNIHDISYISNLTSLVCLNLDGNSIKNYHPLLSLNNLKYLELGLNIEDYSIFTHKNFPHGYNWRFLQKNND